MEDATGPPLRRSEEEGRVPLLGKAGLASPMGWDGACPVQHPRNQIFTWRRCRSEWFVSSQSPVQALRAESLSVAFSLPLCFIVITVTVTARILLVFKSGELPLSLRLCPSNFGVKFFCEGMGIFSFGSLMVHEIAKSGNLVLRCAVLPLGLS